MSIKILIEFWFVLFVSIRQLLTMIPVNPKETRVTSHDIAMHLVVGFGIASVRRDADETRRRQRGAVGTRKRRRKSRPLAGRRVTRTPFPRYYSLEDPPPASEYQGSPPRVPT